MPAAGIGAKDMSDIVSEQTIDLDPAGSDLRPPISDLIPPLAIGQVLRGRYVLEEHLGAGGKGSVFKALDRFRATLPDAQQYVALKVLNAGDCSEHTLANLRREFHCGQALSHPNIVNVYELDCDADVVFFTMELLDGEPLSAVIERFSPKAMRKTQAWQLIQQLGAGLAHAHERGVVHGDLKPRNIFITREGELRILDFGAAHAFKPSKSRSEHTDQVPTSGTPAYASCEQLEGKPADPRDDLYALACICYELLAGTHPFGSRPATLARDYRVSLVRPHGITIRQWRALQKGLSWHRAARSISVRSWMHRLTKESGGEHSVTPLQELAQPNRSESKVVWRAAAVFLVVALITAAVLAQRKSSFAVKTTDSPSPAVTVASNQDAASGSTSTDESTSTNLVATPESSPAKDDVANRAPQAAPQVKAVARATPAFIAVESSQVRSDDHFAEIRLHRNSLQRSGSFTWWTEPATAKPDVDYVPEAVAIQTFPDGYHTARLYVRLLPQSLRSQRSYFYVAIAQPGLYQGPGTVIRRQVWLPTSSSLQAQR
jgi:eukaryotic-like serine/threonine-protein kinase